MAMGEIAYQIRDSVSILVAAEGLEPEFGWPYRPILAEAKLRPGQKPRALAEMIVREYVNHYSDYDAAAGRSVDLAATNLSRMDALRDAVRQLADAFIPLTKEQHQKVLLAHWYAQTYKFNQYVDLRDFCEQAKEYCNDLPGVSDACKAILAVLNPQATDEGAIIKSGVSGFACQYSYGFSIYFPWSVVSAEYAKVCFARDTHWNQFLDLHVNQFTRRATRFLETPKDVQTALLSPGYAAAARRRTGQTARIDPTEAIKKRRTALTLSAEQRIREALPGQEIPERIKELIRKRLDTAEEEAKRLMIPDDDVPREMTRRFLRKSGISARSRYGDHSRYGEHSRYGDHSRYGKHSRYGEHSRFVGDRETWVKNLPPAIGIDFFPRDEKKKTNAGSSSR